MVNTSKISQRKKRFLVAKRTAFQVLHARVKIVEIRYFFGGEIPRRGILADHRENFALHPNLRFQNRILSSSPALWAIVHLYAHMYYMSKTYLLYTQDMLN